MKKTRQSGVYIGLTDRSDVNSSKVKIKMASLCLGLLLYQHLITVMKMPYYNASFGAGKKIKFDSFILDSGLNYALSYVGSDEANIGQSTLKFSSVTSSRDKIYSKIAYDAGKFNPYGKISAEYKFNTKSKIAVIQEDEEISLTQKGTSSEVEVGIRYMPTYATLINFGIAHLLVKKIKAAQNFSLLIDSKI